MWCNEQQNVRTQKRQNENMKLYYKHILRSRWMQPT